MLPDPVPFPSKDPIVVKIHYPAISVLKDTKLRFWGVVFGGEDVRIRARAAALYPNQTTTIEGQPIANVVPPANFGFRFDPLPLRVPIQIVVDVRDKAGRVARDVVNLIAVGPPVTAFDFTIDAVDNRTSSCAVYAYGSANTSGSTLASPTDLTVGGQTVAGSDTIPNEWWDWAVKYDLPADFPHGSGTLRVKRAIATTPPQSKLESQGIIISECGEPEDPDTGGVG